QNIMMPTNGGAALRTERVTRQYQMGAALIRAVDEVSLEVGAAEFLALLGSSGSGKSTLLNLMAGLDRPTSGAILAHDRNLAEINRSLGMTIVLVTHERPLAERFAHRIAELADGKLVSSGSKGVSGGQA